MMDKQINDGIVRKYPLGCGMCGFGLEDYEISVRSLTVDEKRWFASGNGRLEKKSKCQCMMCAALYEAVETIVPIQVGNIKCPRCHSDQKLIYSLTKVEKDIKKFEFEVTISCTKCDKVSKVKKLFLKLLKLVKIEFKTAALKVEAED